MLSIPCYNASGFLEGICMTILVGLSVDYVVHISGAYVQCEEKGREAKIRSALHHMVVFF